MADTSKSEDTESGKTIMGLEYRIVAGSLLFLAGTIAFLGIITAEVLYPGYSTRQDISDLGSTVPPDPVIQEPSATIFNTAMMLTGLLILSGTYLVYRGLDRRLFTALLALLGIGILGVGIFPGNIMPWHGLFALLTFISGGLTVATSSRVVKSPFKYLCLILGVFSLVVLATAVFLVESNPLLFLGSGGVERWVAYPLLIWLIGFGGHLMK